MLLVPVDGPVPGRPPGGSYGHSRLLSYSCVLCPSTWCPVTVPRTGHQNFPTWAVVPSGLLDQDSHAPGELGPSLSPTG